MFFSLSGLKTTPVHVRFSSHPLRGLENFADGTPRVDMSQNWQLSSRGVNQCILYHEVKIILAFQSVQSVHTLSRSENKNSYTDTNALNTDQHRRKHDMPHSPIVTTRHPDLLWIFALHMQKSSVRFGIIVITQETTKFSKFEM